MLIYITLIIFLFWFVVWIIATHANPAGPQGPQGIQGPSGIQGIQGIPGIQGSAGQSFTILGSYANLAAFNADPDKVEGVGNAYILLSDGSLMTWTTLNGGEWFDAGDILGPQGPQGLQGIQGIQGIQGPQGIQGAPGVLNLNRLDAYSTVTQTTAGSENIPVQFDVVESGNTFGFTIANDTLNRPSRITAANAGVYNFQVSLQIHKKAGGGAHRLWSWFRKNEVDEAYSAQTVTLANNGDLLLVTFHHFITMTANQYVESMWRANDSSLELLRNTTVAGVPNIPSAFLTVFQIG